MEEKNGKEKRLIGLRLFLLKQIYVKWAEGKWLGCSMNFINSHVESSKTNILEEQVGCHFKYVIS